jgi:eukaryotic-like serine/threonine-protein kinase
VYGFSTDYGCQIGRTAYSVPTQNPHMTVMNRPKQVFVDGKAYNVIDVRDGGMGRVWILKQAFDEPFDPIYRRRLAVKTFDYMTDERAVEEELNIWISLDHPAILPLKKIGRLNYRIAAIMPLQDGSLDDLLEARGSLSDQVVFKVVREIVGGLEYAWSQFRILHLDLKPSNALFEDRDVMKTRIADWGVSRLVTEKRSSTGFRFDSVRNSYFDQKTAYAAGTPLYMSPERFSGNWRLSLTADVYSLGLMALQMRTGILPFRFGEVDPIAEIATGAYFENAKRILDKHDQAFRQFCLRCIAPNHTGRFQSYLELINYINSVTLAEG